MQELVPYSPFTGKPIVSQSISEMVDKIKNLPKRCTIYLFHQLFGEEKEYKKEILKL